MCPGPTEYDPYVCPQKLGEWGTESGRRKLLPLTTRGKEIDMEMMFNKNRIKDGFFPGDRIYLEKR